MSGLDGSDTSSAVYIDDLNPLNPVTGDPKSQGDDHIRFIKKVLKNTFPSIDAPVTATEDELNILDGVTASAAELNILDGVTASATELNYVDGVTESIQDRFTNLKKFDVTLLLDTGANNEYVMVQDASFGFTIVKAYYKTASGTITANVKINTTSVTSLSALGLTSSEQNATATGANTVAAGDSVSVTFSSNSSAVRAVVQLQCTRT